MRNDQMHVMTPILADEVSAGSVAVGSGMTAVLAVFFGDAVAAMLPYFFSALVVIGIDLMMGIRAARKRGERIRVSRAIRRTLGKIFEYLCWCVLGSSLSVATGYGIILTGVMLTVIGIEVISIAQNWYYVKFGKEVEVDPVKAATAVIEGKAGVDLKGAVKVSKPKPKSPGEGE